MDELVKALRAGEQADMDGTLVKVSRQACEEAADAIEALQAELAEARDKARINGDFDDPDLMRFGPLTESQTEKQIRADERERIAKALDAEADVIPCQEDAMITRSCARLVRTNFSYDDADRLADQQST